MCSTPFKKHLLFRDLWTHTLSPRYHECPSIGRDELASVSADAASPRGPRLHRSFARSHEMKDYNAEAERLSMMSPHYIHEDVGNVEVTLDMMCPERMPYYAKNALIMARTQSIL